MLFCKPATRSKTLIEYPFGRSATVQFRSLDLKKDLNIIHQWVNAPYSRKFWQLDGSIEQLKAVYQPALRNPDVHSFIGLIDEQLICQVDCYRLQADELGKHVRCDYHDAGIHLLMGPINTPIPGLSRKMMEVFMRYFFSFSEAERLYAEPDIYNHKASQLLRKCGFAFVQNIVLSDKAASLHLMTRKNFYATYPTP